MRTIELYQNNDRMKFTNSDGVVVNVPEGIASIITSERRQRNLSDELDIKITISNSPYPGFHERLLRTPHIEDFEFKSDKYTTTIPCDFFDAVGLIPFELYISIEELN